MKLIKTLIPAPEGGLRRFEGSICDLADYAVMLGKEAKRDPDAKRGKINLNNHVQLLQKVDKLSQS